MLDEACEDHCMSSEAQNLPEFLPIDDGAFPEHVFEHLTESQITEIGHSSTGSITVKVADGRTGSYSPSSEPQQRGWTLDR